MGPDPGGIPGRKGETEHKLTCDSLRGRPVGWRRYFPQPELDSRGSMRHTSLRHLHLPHYVPRFPLQQTDRATPVSDRLEPVPRIGAAAG